MIPDKTDLELLRRRPAMFLGDTSSLGLHHLLSELLDNSIDQFLANQATCVKVNVDGNTLEYSDDGPGLPFDEPGQHHRSLAEDYLIQLREDSATADGHIPHIHLDGWGTGLRVVTALTQSCEVISYRNGKVWRQRFFKGVAERPAAIDETSTLRGTLFRLEIDPDIFSVSWCRNRIDQRLLNATYLFPGLQVQSPTLCFNAPRGLADLAAKLVQELGHKETGRIWWFHEQTDDLYVQAAIAGNSNETVWKCFANGSTCIENGTHLTAFKRVVSACKLKPAVALIHVIMRNPRFAGPTRTKLDAPEILSPIYHALKPSLKDFGTPNGPNE